MSEFSKQEEELSIVGRKLSMESITTFWGLFLAEVPRMVARIPGIDTACLTAHSLSSMPQMIFNPDFWNKLKGGDVYRHVEGIGKKMFLVRHELDHYVKTHFNMEKVYGWNHYLSNIAMDLSINTMLLKEAEEVKQSGNKDLIIMELPDGGLIPSLYPELKMESCKDSKYYYDILADAKSKKQQSAGKGEDSKNGEKGNGRGTSGSALLDAQLENEEDWHAGWADIDKGLSEVEKEVRRREVLRRIEQVAEETERRRGTVPLDIKVRLEKLSNIQPPTVSWETLLRRFIGSTISSDIVINRKRPNRRFDEAFATKHKQKVSVFFGSDSSGSVVNEELQRCWVELEHVYKVGGDVWYASWDGECEEPKLFKGIRTTVLERTKAGGTVIDVAIRKMNETAKNNGYCCGVITTDGYIGAITERSKIPLVIIVTPKGSTEFSNPYGYKVIRMN